MKLKVYFIIVLMCYPFNMYSQLPKSFFKTSLLNNLDIYNGSSFTVEYEEKFKLKPFFFKYALNTQIGVYYPFNKLNSIFEKNRGFLLKEEFKLYHKYNKYYSLALSYSISDYLQNFTESNMVYSYLTKRQFFGLDFNFGLLKKLNDTFIFEIYSGIGIRLNKIEPDLSEIYLKNRNYGDWTVPHNWIQKPGLNLIPKFNFGIKIGFIYNSFFVDI